MNLNKFKKFALTTKKTQQITGGVDYFCFNVKTRTVDRIHSSQAGTYPYTGPCITPN